MPSTSLGHQLHASITTVVFNTRTDTLEVIHRFFAHDAEYALRLLPDTPADIIDNPDSRQRFGVYAYDRFRVQGLQNGNQNEVPLTLVGVELDGDFLWVYEKAPIPENITGLSMTNTILREVWPEQSNTVNVERAGVIHTLTFSGVVDELTVSFTGTPLEET